MRLSQMRVLKSNVMVRIEEMAMATQIPMALATPKAMAIMLATAMTTCDELPGVFPKRHHQSHSLPHYQNARCALC